MFLVLDDLLEIIWKNVITKLTNLIDWLENALLVLLTENKYIFVVIKREILIFHIKNDENIWRVSRCLGLAET